MIESDTTGCEGEVIRTIQILEMVDFVEGIGEIELVLIPNPARGKVMFSWGSNEIQQANVSVFDVRGAEVLQAVTTSWLNVESLAPGRYTVVVQTVQGQAALPLMIQ